MKSMQRRAEWHQHWVNIARESAKMSTCASGRQVGAVVVTAGNILLTTGYNGVPSKVPHPTECARKLQQTGTRQNYELCLCMHAEVNAIANAAKIGVSLAGAVLYVTRQPCKTCFGLVINAGIAVVHYAGPEEDLAITKLARFLPITLIQLGDSCDTKTE